MLITLENKELKCICKAWDKLFCVITKDSETDDLPLELREAMDEMNYAMFICEFVENEETDKESKE